MVAVPFLGFHVCSFVTTVYSQYDLYNNTIIVNISGVELYTPRILKDKRVNVLYYCRTMGTVRRTTKTSKVYYQSNIIHYCCARSVCRASTIYNNIYMYIYKRILLWSCRIVYYSKCARVPVYDFSSLVVLPRRIRSYIILPGAMSELGERRREKEKKKLTRHVDNISRGPAGTHAVLIRTQFFGSRATLFFFFFRFFVFPPSVYDFSYNFRRDYDDLPYVSPRPVSVLAMLAVRADIFTFRTRFNLASSVYSRQSSFITISFRYSLWTFSPYSTAMPPIKNGRAICKTTKPELFAPREKSKRYKTILLHSISTACSTR